MRLLFAEEPRVDGFRGLVAAGKDSGKEIWVHWKWVQGKGESLGD